MMAVASDYILAWAVGRRIVTNPAIYTRAILLSFHLFLNQSVDVALIWAEIR